MSMDSLGLFDDQFINYQRNCIRLVAQGSCSFSDFAHFCSVRQGYGGINCNDGLLWGGCQEALAERAAECGSNLHTGYLGDHLGGQGKAPSCYRDVRNAGFNHSSQRLQLARRHGRNIFCVGFKENFWKRQSANGCSISSYIGEALLGFAASSIRRLSGKAFGAGFALQPQAIIFSILGFAFGVVLLNSDGGGRQAHCPGSESREPCGMGWALKNLAENSHVTGSRYASAQSSDEACNQCISMMAIHGALIILLGSRFYLPMGGG